MASRTINLISRESLRRLFRLHLYRLDVPLSFFSFFIFCVKVGSIVMEEEDDPVMSIKLEMYEAKAIVVEKEILIDRLEREKSEMEERIRQLELRGGVDTSSKGQFDAVWMAIKNIQEKLEESSKNNKERMEQLKTETGDLVSGMERTVKDIESIKKRLEDEKRSSQGLQLSKLEEKVERIEMMLGVIVRGQLHEYVEKIRQTSLETEISPESSTVQDRNKDGTILILGGSSGQATNEILILNGKRTEWKPLYITLPCKRTYGGAVCLNDEIFIFGGEGLFNKLYKLDGNMKWIELAEMPGRRTDISSSSLVFNDCIWVFGGSDGSKVLNNVDKYCPKTNEWKQMPKMQVARRAAAAAAYNGKIFVSGGYNEADCIKSVESFDPQAGIWSLSADLPVDCACHSMLSYGGNLTVVGGYNDSQYFSTVWMRNKEKNSAWKKLQPMEKQRRRTSTVLFDNEIFVIGGWNGKEHLKEVEIFNGAGWRDGPPLPKACDGVSSVVVSPKLRDILCQFQK